MRISITVILSHVVLWRAGACETYARLNLLENRITSEPYKTIFTAGLYTRWLVVAFHVGRRPCEKTRDLSPRKVCLSETYGMCTSGIAVAWLGAALWERASQNSRNFRAILSMSKMRDQSLSPLVREIGRMNKVGLIERSP